MTLNRLQINPNCFDDYIHVPVKPEQTKQCYRCRRHLPKTLSYWYKDKSHKDGLHSKCKDCARQANLARYQQREIFKVLSALMYIER